MRVALFGAAAALVLAAGGASAATKKPVTIDEDGFKPPIAIVAPGTDVTWTNGGNGKHSTVGSFWSSGDLAPGTSYTARFNRFGEFPYHDGLNPDATGTVVVIAGTTRPGAAGGRASYRYRATVAFSAREEWEYWDSQWRSTKGACNGLVGKGSRVVRWTARPLVTYTRIAGIEVLHSDRPAPTRLAVYRETQDAKIAGNGNSVVTCQDGTTREPPADLNASCDENLTGKLLKISIGWAAKSTKNKLGFTNSGPDIAPRPEQCGGPSHVGALVLVHVNNEDLPLWLVGDKVLFDEGQAGPLTKAEVAALRAGRSVHIVRGLDLDFTAPCCVGYEPPSGPRVGVLARIGAIIRVRAQLDVRLTRR